MSRNRLNPWPAVADLFSALSVVAFAALILIALASVVLSTNEQIEHDTARDLAGVFEKNYKTGAPISVAPCRDREKEECLEIPFRFVRNESALSEDGREQVSEACQVYRMAANELLQKMEARGTPLKRSSLVLVIEGHTDSTTPHDIRDQRKRFLFNWTLSSERAASVLYEFLKCGVSPETGYRISSVGLADTRKICQDDHPDEACHEKNRRITMRIRVLLDTFK